MKSGKKPTGAIAVVGSAVAILVGAALWTGTDPPPRFFDVPGLQYGGSVLYRLAAPNPTTSLEIGEQNLDRSDPWGARTSCVMVGVSQVSRKGLMDHGYCVDQKGAPVDYEFLMEGLQSPGQSVPSWGVHPPALEVLPILLQGQRLKEHAGFSLNFSGAPLQATVLEADNSGAVVDLALGAHELMLEPTGERVWSPVTWVTRLTYVAGIPFPKSVREVGNRNLVADADLEEWKAGKPSIPPFDLQGAPLICPNCIWSPFDKIPPLDGPFAWRFREALKNASEKPEVSEFLARPASVVLQANFSLDTETEEIVGPLVRLATVATWGIVIIDGDAQEKLSLALSRRAATPTAPEKIVWGNTTRSRVDFSFPRTAWPARLVNISTAFLRISNSTHDNGPKFFEYNPVLDGEYFSSRPRAFTRDPLQQNDIHPMFFHAKMVLAAGNFEFSLVNGQWLYTPSP